MGDLEINNLIHKYGRMKHIELLKSLCERLQSEQFTTAQYLDELVNSYIGKDDEFARLLCDEYGLSIAEQGLVNYNIAKRIGSSTWALLY